MLKQIASHLFTSESVALFVHKNPDWDCIGSAFALRAALRAAGVQCDIFTEEALSHYLSFMESDVIPYRNGFSPDYDVCCAIDVGEAARMGLWANFFCAARDTVCIDHHIQRTAFAKMSYVEKERCCTGELIYELLRTAKATITKRIAEYLYLAMSSDTGAFRYAGVNRRTYEILAELYDTGIDTAYLSAMLYERDTLPQMKLRARAIESLTLYGDGKICTAMITADDLKHFGASKSDTEGLAQLPRQIDGVEISVFLSDREDGTVRASLRATGDRNIEPVARLFGGGGHSRAAGCTFETDIRTAEQMLVKELLKL